MMTLIAAAAVAAAQPAPSVQMDAMHPEQHGSMNNNCCKDCCNKHGERDAHSPEAKPQRGR